MNVMEVIDKFKLPIGLGIVGLVLIIGSLIFSQFSKKEIPTSFPKESLVGPATAKSLMVDVSGAVNHPGVYSFGSEARVEDALKSAGGLSKDANTEYISKQINMAQKLSDGMKIYLPKLGEVAGISAVSGGSMGNIGGKGSQGGIVNLNSASQAELEGLPGIGPVTAAKIISSRPYSKIDDLLSQKLVSKSVFDKIKDLISL